jgi:hypothetical protein
MMNNRRLSMMMMRLICPVIIIFMLIALGCSGTGGTTTPPAEIPERNAGSDAGHMLWGMYQFVADPQAQTLEVVPMHNADMHLNVLPFLEPPPFVNLALESLEFNGNIIETDIGLKHPFLGLTEFTGFDVCGIMITMGNVAGFTDNRVRLAGDGDTRLLNADGYSRWWNPSEFPHDGSWTGYKDGLLGTPDYMAHYNCTVNGYKYFCDDLTSPNSTLDQVSLENRGMFSAGKKIVRHYTIELGLQGLVFNYAIDACWEFPTGGYPWKAPDDFPEAANRPEPWWVDAHVISNGLWNFNNYTGGSLSMSIDVYDWFNTEMNILSVESPGNFEPLADMTPSGSGQGYSTYEVEIADATPAPGEIQVLITAECEDIGFGGKIPANNTSAYQVIYVPVADEPIGELEAMGTAEIMPYFDGFRPTGTPDDPIPTEWYIKLDASQSTGPIAEYLWEIDGDDLFDDAKGKTADVYYDFPGSYVIKLKITNGAGGEDVYELPGSFEIVEGTYVSCQQC